MLSEYICKQLPINKHINFVFRTANCINTGLSTVPIFLKAIWSIFLRQRNWQIFFEYHKFWSYFPCIFNVAVWSSSGRLADYPIELKSPRFSFDWALPMKRVFLISRALMKMKTRDSAWFDLQRPEPFRFTADKIKMKWLLHS